MPPSPGAALQARLQHGDALDVVRPRLLRIGPAGPPFDWAERIRQPFLLCQQFCICTGHVPWTLSR